MVQDESGAALPDAQVTLHSEGENSDRVVTADATGGFTIENVKPGEYVLRASRSGFSETEMRGIVVEARQDVRETVTMSIAAQSTTVEVSAAADQINSENAAIGDSKNNLQMTQLPLNNRATTTSPLGRWGFRRMCRRTVRGILRWVGQVRRW